MTRNANIKEQLRRNAVALISLVIAVTSLGYNTWRNESSEYNRNQRLVAIQILSLLGDLEQLVLDKQFGENIDGEAILRSAWAKMRSIRDYAKIAEGEVPAAAQALFDVWSAEYKKLGEERKAQVPVQEAIEQVRRDTHDVLRSLD